MREFLRYLHCFIRRLLLTFLVFLPSLLSAQEGDVLSQGRFFYEKHCAVCHGGNGNGQGKAATLFQMKPRDFTKGQYKIKSTPSGTLPLDEDLMRSIKLGLPGTAMVPQNFLADNEIRSLVAYIKSFSPRFSQAQPGKAIALPPAPSLSPEQLPQGQRAYQKNQCIQCHGPEGKGNGVLAKDLTIKPADLTQRPLKVGSTIQDIARTILTGMEGTPMPPYQFIIEGQELWYLAYYINSLGEQPQETNDEKKGKEIVKKILQTK